MTDRPTTEPRTEAGRRLAEADAQALWSPAEVRAAILAIEAEAAQGAAPHEHQWKREYAPNYRQASEANDWREECACGAFRSGTDDPLAAPRAEGRTVVRIHHGDPDSHARSFNQGWDEALRDAIADIPEGVYDGWSRYDTDNTHVLSIHADGETWDVIAPKEPAA